MKTSMFPARSLRALSVVAAAALLGACATMGGKPEDVVAQRAQAYWDARIKGDTTAAYALLSPGYRKLHTQTDFSKEYASTSAVEAQVKKVQCTEDKCTVSTRLVVTPVLPGMMAMQKPVRIENYTDSIWLLEDGKWGLFLQP